MRLFVAVFTVYVCFSPAAEAGIDTDITKYKTCSRYWIKAYKKQSGKRINTRNRAQVRSKKRTMTKMFSKYEDCYYKLWTLVQIKRYIADR